MSKKFEEYEYDEMIPKSKRQKNLEKRFAGLPMHVFEMYTYEELERMTPTALGRLMNGYDEGRTGRESEEGYE